MKPLKGSSNIDATSHNGGSLLSVRFKNGHTYNYENVTPKMHAELRESGSPGKWLLKDLVRKSKSYPATKMEVKKK